jgi:hypothetical protein
MVGMTIGAVVFDGGYYNYDYDEYYKYYYYYYYKCSCCTFFE